MLQYHIFTVLRHSLRSIAIWFLITLFVISLIVVFLKLLLNKDKFYIFLTRDLLTLTLAILLLSVALCRNIIVSGSMLPNFTYNCVYSGLPVLFCRPGMSLKRGDVVTFVSPTHPNRVLVKRIIGLPGDIVSIKDKNLWINGKKRSYHTNIGEELDPKFVEYIEWKTGCSNLIWVTEIDDNNNSYNVIYHSYSLIVVGKE